MFCTEGLDQRSLIQPTRRSRKRSTTSNIGRTLTCIGTWLVELRLSLVLALRVFGQYSIDQKRPQLKKGLLPYKAKYILFIRTLSSIHCQLGENIRHRPYPKLRFGFDKGKDPKTLKMDIIYKKTICISRILSYHQGWKWARLYRAL